MKIYIVAISLIILTVIISACGTGTAQIQPPQVTTLEAGDITQTNTDEFITNDQTLVNSPGISDALSEAEVLGLVYMREEEKLAHDVYMVLYSRWGLPIFQNIASSELTHTEAVRSLLEKYNIPDPVVGNLDGQFSNQDLQALYDQLIAAGSTSLNDALVVGTSIEEIDILDLEERIGQTELFDITQVYENLLSGSENHLRAFVATLEKQTNQIFQPNYLPLITYERIMAGDFRTGQGNGQMMGKGKQN